MNVGGLPDNRTMIPSPTFPLIDIAVDHEFELVWVAPTTVGVHDPDLNKADTGDAGAGAQNTAKAGTDVDAGTDLDAGTDTGVDAGTDADADTGITLGTATKHKGPVVIACDAPANPTHLIESHPNNHGAAPGSAREPGSPPTEQFLSDLATVVDDLADIERQIHRLHARKQAALNRAVQLGLDEAVRSNANDSRSEILKRTVQASIAAELHVTGRTVSAWMDFAYRLTNSFPLTSASLGAGDLSREHVAIITDQGMIIRDSRKRAQYEREVIRYALTASPSRLRPFAKRLAEHLTDDTLEERHAAARQKRGVWVDSAADGMSWLKAYLPADEAAAIHDRLSQIALRLYDEDAGGGNDAAMEAPSTDVAHQTPPRKLAERRADALCDLLLQTDPFAVGTLSDSQDGPAPRIDARVQVVIPIMNLIGRAPEQCPAGLDRFAGLFGPADCTGYGPMNPEAARVLAGEAGIWDRVLVHPISGTVLEVDRYRPSQAMRRLLGARDQHCRFPGCAAPIWRSDLDHTINYAHGGGTHIDNLSYLCRSHHTLKHHGSWNMKQEGGGDIAWQSPAGKSYVDRPTSRVMFTPLPTTEPPDRDNPASTGPPPSPGPPDSAHRSESRGPDHPEPGLTHPF